MLFCGDLTILLLGLAFHCFVIENRKSLCHSLGRPSRSDFVQLYFCDVFQYILYLFCDVFHIISTLFATLCITSPKKRDISASLIHFFTVRSSHIPQSALSSDDSLSELLLHHNGRGTLSSVRSSEPSCPNLRRILRSSRRIRHPEYHLPE